MAQKYRYKTADQLRNYYIDTLRLAWEWEQKVKLNPNFKAKDAWEFVKVLEIEKAIVAKHGVGTIERPNSSAGTPLQKSSQLNQTKKLPIQKCDSDLRDIPDLSDKKQNNAFYNSTTETVSSSQSQNNNSESLDLVKIAIRHQQSILKLLTAKQQGL